MEKDSGEDMKQLQPQDRRLRPPQSEQNQPQQPQSCPRCESLNTKFCYYNNYSLSQPRYFCKACRRYWTQGGTLRNVPVGGGCRKAKRSRTSTSHENPLTSPPPQVRQSVTAPPATTKEASSYYPGGGFFSSNLNQNPVYNQIIDQSVGGSDVGGSSNLGLLGFNSLSFGSQNHQQIQSREFFQVGNERDNTDNIYPSEESLVQFRGSTSSGPQLDWLQSFSRSVSTSVPDATLWSSSTSNSINGTNPTSSQWPNNLPGYGPPS